jgi:hypothetical protein
MDFDPRHYDDDLRLPDVQVRDHDDETRDLGRGPGDDARQVAELGDRITGAFVVIDPGRARVSRPPGSPTDK